MKIKSLFFYLLAIGTIFSSCDEDPADILACEIQCPAGQIVTIDCTCYEAPTQVTTELEKAGFISADETWTKDIVYTLKGKVVVDNGVTLTIEPGTIIKGASGVGSLASALVVAQGGKLLANGTAEDPIIMTSVDDNIEPGQTNGTNLDETTNGLWGGLIVLGKAPISVDNDAEFAQIEGIPADDVFGRYGGTDPMDNSGSITYVSVRHGGALIGDGNEINGITLGGVGSGTTIENIEIVANKDDGMEWFGGNVNVKNLLIWAADDDGVDIDQAYSGTVDNFVVICNGTDHALEIDGPEGSVAGKFTLRNGSVYGADQELGDMRDGATGNLSNIWFTGFSADPAVAGEGDFSISGDNSAATYAAGDLTFMGFELTSPTGVNVTAAQVFKDFTEADQMAVKLVDAPTGGATLSVFDWTYAKAASKF